MGVTMIMGVAMTMSISWAIMESAAHNYVANDTDNTSDNHDFCVKFFRGFTTLEIASMTRKMVIIQIIIRLTKAPTVSARR
jgi:hypothetical protein